MNTATTDMKASQDATEVLFELPPMNGKATAPATVKINSRQVFRAAEDSAEFFDHLRAHYRETRRTPVEIPCDVRLQLPDGSTFDSGSATVRNVSPSGALLGALNLPKKCLPTGMFKVVLVLRGGEYNGIGIEATPVRLAEAGGLGVKFDEIFVSV
ncbi:MAG TPA: hypothetical protein VEJ63_00370 [Planctomycetota bacterium]|nr:hypothetical protein [Planctomycetota bacterium]